MTPPTIFLHTFDPEMIEAWTNAFSDLENVNVIEGDILLGKADAIVSPANSFGFMDGGIDHAYLRFFGPGLQGRLQLKIRTEWFGELPVGQSEIVETEHAAIPYLISAPTMRIPDRIPNTVNVYLAFRAALMAVVKRNHTEAKLIQSVKFPALGTGIGAMPVNRAARQMRAAYDSVFEKPRWMIEPNAILVHHEAMKSW